MSVEAYEGASAAKTHGVSGSQSQFCGMNPAASTELRVSTLRDVT